MDLALTLDYELFGDGSGDLFTDVINPTNEILETCSSYNAKITIFFEVVEYWRINEEWNKGNHMGYLDNPIVAMENQMRGALRAGHDIQLHVHPQWINAQYNRGWIVDDNWCMKDIPLSSTESFDMNLISVLHKGKETLEQLLKPELETYCCNIFRAGGFNMLPSKNIISALKELGFKVDSSVFYGGYDRNNETDIDFRTLKNKVAYWSVDNGDVLNQNSVVNEGGNIIELPVFSAEMIRYRKYDFHRLSVLFKNSSSAKKTFKSRVDNKTLLEKCRFFFEYEYLTWDFCLFNISKTKRFILLAKKIQEQSDGYHPFILIGHAKGFNSSKTLEYLLNFSLDNNFITLTQVLNKTKVVDCKTSIKIKEEFCKSELKSYDPYDIWKTDLGIRVRKLFYKNKLLGLAPAGLLTIYDLYLNNNFRFGYRAQEYPIVRAMAALSLINIYEKRADTEALEFSKKHIYWLIEHSSKECHGDCWGLGFEWVYSDTCTYDENTPFSTHTPYPLEALVKYHKITEDPFVLNTIKRVFLFLEHDLKVMKEDDDILIISYGKQKDRIVTNANSYVLYMYSLLLPYMPEEKQYIENKVKKIYAFIKSVQHDNGSWLYSPYEYDTFIDCFHSAFIIKNIVKTNNIINLENSCDITMRGYSYILDNFLVFDEFLFKRFSQKNKLSLIKFDLYDNAEMLNLALLLDDMDTYYKLHDAIKINFYIDSNVICSVIDIFGIRKNKNHLRWAVAPYLYTLSK